MNFLTKPLDRSQWGRVCRAQALRVLPVEFASVVDEPPNMAVAAMRNLLRLGELPWHDMLWIGLFDGAKGVFAHPVEAFADGWVNFALEFQHIFTRRIAVTALRKGNPPQGWSASLRLPVFDVWRPQVGGVDSMWLGVDFPRRGVARIRLQSGVNMVCREFVAGEGARLLNRWREAGTDLPFLLNLFRLDPGNPLVLTAMGGIAPEDWVEVPDALKRVAHLRMVDLLGRLEEARRRLIDLWQAMRERASPAKLRLHFPPDDLQATAGRWDQWHRLLESGAHVLESVGGTHPEAILFSAADNWLKEAASIRMLQVPDPLDRLFSRAWRSAAAEMAIAGGKRFAGMDRLEDFLHASSGREGPSLTAAQARYKAIWCAVEKVFSLPFVRTVGLEKALMRALVASLKDECGMGNGT